ncbi:MAG: TfoX/Sxy family protein [Planctomycetota bacterium]|nr:TfoX/Sxy family protein [Planctomycetota bacterium]MDA1247626.1 TfoX/Sxy family protein [Planctomycetota bacterium]
MAYDEKQAQILRDSLADLDGITEKKMFGGLCFLLNGNMLCGVDKDGGMARVGKEHGAAALELPGVDPLSFTGRKMGGMVDVSEGALKDNSVRKVVLSLAREFVGAMPAK